MNSHRVAPIVILKRLIEIGEKIASDRRVQISDASLRAIADEVHAERHILSDGVSPIDYQAACLVECIKEVAYARSDKDQNRESRAICYVNSFVAFMRTDLANHERVR